MISPRRESTGNLTFGVFLRTRWTNLVAYWYFFQYLEGKLENRYVHIDSHPGGGEGGLDDKGTPDFPLGWYTAIFIPFCDIRSTSKTLSSPVLWWKNSKATSPSSRMLTTAFLVFCLIGLSLSEFKGSTISPRDLDLDVSDLFLWFRFDCSALACFSPSWTWEKSRPESLVTLLLPRRRCCW